MIKWSESGTGVRKKSIDWSSHKDLLKQPEPVETPQPQQINQVDPLTNAQNLFTGKGFQAFGKTIGLPKPVSLNQSRYNPFSSLDGMIQINTNTGGSTQRIPDVNTPNIGLKEVVGAPVGVIGGLTGFITGAIGGSIVAQKEGKTGKEYWNSVGNDAIKNAKDMYEKGTNVGATGAVIGTAGMISPTLLAATFATMSVIGIGNTIFKTYNDFEKLKESDADHKGIRIVDKFLTNGAKEGYRMIGFDEESINSITGNSFGDAIGNILLYGGAYLLSKQTYKGAKPKVKQLSDFLTKDKITEYQIPERVKISGAEVREILGQSESGGLNMAEKKDLFNSMNFTNKERADLARANNYEGQDLIIEKPTEVIVKLIDKPWFSKIKNKLNIKPFEKIISSESMGNISRAPAGLIEGASGKPLSTDRSFRFAGQESLGKKPQVINTDGPKLDFNAPAMVDKTPSIERQIIKPSGSDPKNFKTAEDYVKAQTDPLYEYKNLKTISDEFTGRSSVKEAINDIGGLKNVERGTIDINRISPTENMSLSGDRGQAVLAEIKSGIRTPLVLDDFGNGLEIIDGNHRYLAYKSLGISDIPVIAPKGSGINILPKSQLISEWNKAHPLKSSLVEETKKYKTTININDKNDLEYLGRILSEDNIKDIQQGKMTNFRGIPYEDLAKVNIISETPKTVEQQLAGKIKDVKLKSDTFYHGTSAENARGIMESGFKSGSELPEEIFRGGGYGKMQSSISLTETPNDASRFSTLTKNGEIVEAKLKPNSKVVSIKGVEDAVELEDYISYLKKQKVDAVYIGGGEKELVVINPKAITPTKSQLTDIWNKANKKVPVETEKEAIKLTTEFDINKPNSLATRKAAFESETLEGLANAEAGKRIVKDTGIDKEVIGIKSTFPKWIPSEFRKSSIVQPVREHILNGTIPTKKNELKFYNLIKKKFDDFYKMSSEVEKEINVDDIKFEKKQPKTKENTKSKASSKSTAKSDKGDYVKIERSKNDTDLKAIQTPEQYRLAKAIGPDVDIIMKNSRSFNGYFRSSPSPELAMNRKLYKRKEGETKEDYQLRIGKTLAHEIGHFIDYLPDANLNRGNLIGRLNTLSDFKKNFITEPDVLKERQKLMRKINEINKDEALLDETKAKLVEPYIKELAKLEDKITFNNPIFKEQLTKLTHIWKPWEEGLDPNYDSYRKSAAELYADFVSVLFNDPGLAQKTAPSFYNQFFKSLGKKPEVEKAFLNIQAELMGERTSLMKKRYDLLKNSGKTAAQKFAAVVAARDAIRNKPWYKTLDADLWYQHAKAIKDKNITVENQFELLDRGTNNELMIKLENKVMPIFDTLRKSGLDDNDLDVILKLERIAKDEGRLNVANTKGFDQMTSEEVLNELENIHSKEKAKALYKAAKDFREVLRETQLEFPHLWTPEQLKLINDNKFYSVFNVLFNESNNVSHFIKSSTGNIDKDFNTVVNTLLRLRSVVSYGTRNNIKLTITEEFAKAGKGDIQKAKVTRVPMKDGTLQRNVAEPPQGWGTVDIKRNGKLESYYFPEDIAKSLNQEAMADLLGPLKLLRAMNKPFKYLYTGPVNIGFQIANFAFRDWGTTSLFFGPEWTRSQLGKSNSGLNVIANNTYRHVLSKTVQAAYYLKAFKLALDKNIANKYSHTMVEMLKNHVVEVDAGGLFQIDSKNMNEQDMAGVKYLLKMWGLIEKGSKLKRIGQTISAITQSLEETSKIAAHMYFKDLGILNERNLVNIRNHVGSPNFWKKGRQAHNISSTYLFYNPIVQGLNNLGVKATIKDAAGKGSRSAFWWRMIRKAIIPTMAIVAAEEGYFGEDIREKVYLMPEYIKSSYIPIPIGLTDNDKVKYLSFPQDEEARVVQAIFRNILKMAIHSDDKATRNRAVTDILAYTGGQIPSPAPLINIGGKWITTARGGNPYDAFRSQHIFYKGSEDELPFWDKAEIMAKWTLNQNGILKFNVHDRIENRTVEEQTIASIPGLNRFLRIDNRGAYEENAKIMREIREREAVELVRKKKIVNDIVKNIHDDPSYKPNEDILKLVNERVGADATIKGKTKEFKTLLSATQEEYIAAYDSVHYRSMMNQSTEVKEAIAVNLWMNDRMDEKEFNMFLIRGVALGVLSQESLGTILMETQAGNK